MKRFLIGIFIVIYSLVVVMNVTSIAEAAPNVFSPSQGGTGTSTVPVYGQILVGNSSNKYDLVSPNVANGWVQLDSNGNITATVIPRLDYLSHLSSIVLQQGELAIATDTSPTQQFFVGDGVTAGGQFMNPWAASSTKTYYNLGNVGIGTSSPSASLSITGTTSNPTFALRPVSGQNSDVFDIYDTNGVVQNRFTTSGYWEQNLTNAVLLINSLNLSSRPSFFTGGEIGSAANIVAYTNIVNDGIPTLWVSSQLTNQANQADLVEVLANQSNNPTFVINPNGDMGFAGSNDGSGSVLTGSLDVIKAATGYLGIGTTSPSVPLSIVGNILASTTATSTFQGNGINLTAGCFAINGTCVSGSGGGGSGTVNSGSTNQAAYYAAGGTTLSGSSALTISGSNVGIGTSSPFAPLSVGGAAYIGGDLTATGTAILGNGSATIKNISLTGLIAAFTGSAASGGTVNGIKSDVTNTNFGGATGVLGIARSANTNSGILEGIIGNSVYSGGGALATAYGIYGQVQNTGVGSIVNAYSVYGDTPLISSGSITNAYAGGFNGNVWVGGNLGLGTTTPTAALVSVAASSTVATTAYNGLVNIIAGLENTTTKLFQEIDQWGHMIVSGDAPTLTSCSGGSVNSASNDRAGAVTFGTGLTSCGVVFAHPYPSGTTVHVFINQDTGTLLTSDATSISTTGFTISAASIATGDQFSYTVVATQ